MKTVGKILVGLVAVALLVVAVHAAYTRLLPHWVSIAFYTYCSLGLFTLVYGTYVIRADARRRRTTTDQLTEALVEVSRKQDLWARFNRVREAVALGARVVASALVWPVDAALGILMRGRKTQESARDFTLRFQLNAAEQYYSLYVLAAVAVLCGLEFRGVHLGMYGSLVLAMLLANATLRHVRYAVDTTHLPAVLRRISEVPYVAFIAIIAADFATIVLVLTALDHSDAMPMLTLGDLRATAHQVLEAEEPLKVIKGLQLTLHELTVAVVGLLFYLALAKIVTEFKEFARQDEDHLWLAQIDNQLGQFALALRHLDKVKSPTLEARGARAIALLGVNDLKAAEETIDLMLIDQHKERTPEEVFANLWQGCLFAPVPQEVHLAALKRAIELKVSDVFIQDMIGTSVQSSPLVAQNVGTMFPADSANYPLTAARLALVRNDMDAAREILKSTKPVNPVDEIVWRVMHVSVLLSDPHSTEAQDMQSFQQWLDENLPVIRELMNKASKPWERVVVFVQLTAILEGAKAGAPARVQELTYLSDYMKAQTQGEDAKRGLKFVERVVSKQAGA
jgi:hypothetical protein